MKKIFGILLFVLFCQVGFSQTYEFKTTGYSVSLKNPNNDQWTKWSKTQPTEILITLDRNKHRFVIYSEIIQLFNIVKYEEKVENAEGTFNKYICVDNEGLNTEIKIITPKDAGPNKQIYITNEEMIIEYDVVYIGEKK